MHPTHDRTDARQGLADSTRYHLRLGLLLTAHSLLLLAATQSSASTSSGLKTRLEPSGDWCPVGLTTDEGRPGLESSRLDRFDSGDLETSFRTSSDGWVYVTIVAIGDVLLDNIVISERIWSFSQTPSDECHNTADPDFPRVRAPAFDTTAVPVEIDFLETFNITSLDELGDRGWEISNVVLLPSTSATEHVAPGSQTDITRDCSAGGPGCPLGSGSLQMTTGSRIRFPVRLAGATDYALTAWWAADAGARLSVRVEDFASCPEPPDGLFVDHTSDLEIDIISAVIDSGIDPDVWDLIVDQSDTFGFVEVDGQRFEIPQIDNNDTPTWDGSARFSVHDLANPENVSVRIELYDNDEFENGHIDIDPSPIEGRKDLDLTVDLCRMTVEGDLSGDLAGTLDARGDDGAGDDQGHLKFLISTPTGKPVSTDDLAITDLDFVQSVHRTRFAVSELPGVVMVSAANNFATSINTFIDVDVSGPDGFLVSRRFPITLDGESTKTFYFFDDTPIVVPGLAASPPSVLNINARIDPDGVYSGGLDPSDCRRDNDEVAEKQWKIVVTDPLEVHWCKVGRQIEAQHFVSDSKLFDVESLGTTFMNGIYPTRVTARPCPVPMPITPLGSTLDFLFTLLEGIGIPAGSVEPFAMVWDINTFAALAGMNKILGVLPNASWYGQFLGWENVRGNSLGEAAPHAAILLPEIEDNEGDRHVPITLPAHELSHTFGLSADSRLKDTFSCGITLPGDIFGWGALVCGASGGLDEYTASDPARVQGNPATGYWLEKAPPDPRMAHLLNNKQCDRHCFMGTSDPGQLDDWGGRGKWIDLEDWEHLIGRLKTHPDPEVIYVSGIIDAADNALLGPFFTMPAGIPDRVHGDPGEYRLLFFDAANFLVQDVGFPADFGATEFEQARPPATFFGFTVPWVRGTARIEIVRQGGDTIPSASVGERFVSATPPVVSLASPHPRLSRRGARGGQLETIFVGPGESLDLQWDASDADGDDLVFVVMASADGGDNWSVLRGWIEEERSVEIPSRTMPDGELLVRVVATDGVHRSESEPLAVEFMSGLIFSSDFEDGHTSTWSVTAQ